MILDHPKNILLKIKSNKDNSNSENIAKNSAFFPGLPQNSNNSFNPINKFCFPCLINNYQKEDLSTQTQLNNIQNNAIIPTTHPTSNIKFKINNSVNISTNSNDEPSNILQNQQKQEQKNNQTKFKLKENIKFKKRKFFKKFKICHIEYQKIQKDKEKSSSNKLKHKR